MYCFHISENVPFPENIRQDIRNSQNECKEIIKNPPMSFNYHPDIKFEHKELLELSLEDELAVITKFYEKSLKLTNTLKYDMKPDNIVLFMKCLSKLSKVQFEHSKMVFMDKISNSNFTLTLEKYLWNLPFFKIKEKLNNKYFWDDPNNFWENTFCFYEHVLATVPYAVIKILPRLFNVIKMTIINLQIEQMEYLDPKLQEKFESLVVQLKVAKQKHHRKLVIIGISSSTSYTYNIIILISMITFRKEKILMKVSQFQTALLKYLFFPPSMN